MPYKTMRIHQANNIKPWFLILVCAWVLLFSAAGAATMPSEFPELQEGTGVSVENAHTPQPCAVNSFPADTVVHAKPQGANPQDAQHAQATLKAISQLQVGDEVLAIAEWKDKGTTPQQDQRLSYEKVTDIFTSFKEQTLVHLLLANGEQLTATEGHPFKTTEGWRDAVMLKKGGKLLLKGGDTDSEPAVEITEIRTERKTLPVYNIEVANAHTYFVGIDGVGVHNAGCNKAKYLWQKAREKHWKSKGYPDGKPPTREVRVKDRKTGREYDRVERKELHHNDPQRNNGSNEPQNLKEVWPTEHADIDPYRRPGYDVIKVYK